MLTKAEIWNFRSISHLTVNFTKCSILVGKNNSGKSNIIRAIDLVIGERPKPSKDDFFNKDNGEGKTICVNLTFILTDEKVEELVNMVDKPRKISEGNWISALEYHDALRTTNEVQLGVEIAPDFSYSKPVWLGGLPYPYPANEFRDAIVTSFHIPSSRDHSKMLKTYEYGFFGKLLNQLYNLAEEGMKDDLNNRLAEAHNACKNMFQQSEDELNNISKQIIDHEGITLSFLPSNPKDIYKKIEILINDGIETDLDFKGTGIQSVLIISLFKLFSQIKGGNALLLLEEPELFLHPQANRHMAFVLRSFCDSNGLQLVISTHSPQYILDREFSDIILVKKSGIQTSTKQVASLTDNDKLRKELTASSLELFFADKVVLVEGRSDKLLLPAYAESANQAFNFDRKNISIIEVGSKSNLPSYIELLTAFEIPYLAVVDHDFYEKTAVRPLNRRFAYGIDVERHTEAEIERLLNAHRIYPLKYGEIENYYHKDWLYMVLCGLVNEANLPANVKEAAIITLNQFNDIANKNAVDTEMGLLVNGLDADNYSVIFKAIGIKAQLLPFNLKDPDKISKKLETIFGSFDMTKPIIALRVRHHVNINDLPIEKRNDFMEICNKIFE
jgi:putative ATP-dependent endonuclease of the OLD family